MNEKKKFVLDFINGSTPYLASAISRSVFDILRETDDLYTNDGESYITDSEYDKLRLLAQKYWPSDPYFIGVGSSVRVDKVKLPYKMGSLDQVQVGELPNWIKTKNGKNRNFVITDKMDGVSVLLVYNSDGDFQIALTRGDGYEGQDITRHVKLIPDVPKKVLGRLVVRAEIIFSESTFKKIQNKVTRQDGTPFKNPRNAVAGLVNHKTVNELACKHLSVFAYSIEGSKDDLSKERQLKFLKILGFNVVHFEKISQKIMTEDYLKNKIVERKGKLDFAIDGIVVEFLTLTIFVKLLWLELNGTFQNMVMLNLRLSSTHSIFKG
jgi:DNA ligase (NAD+)